MGAINLIGNAVTNPRFAKVIGLGFKSGRLSSSADALYDASIAAKASNIPSDVMNAERFASAGYRNTNKAINTLSTAKNYAKFHGLDFDDARGATRLGHRIGRAINPVLTPVEKVALPIGRIAGATMMHPAGQMALFMGAPMLMMSGGGSEEVPTEHYQQQPMDGYAPMPVLSQMPAPMMASSALDEEQIRRARKRAEEQAALQQFYAQALSQYGGS